MSSGNGPKYIILGAGISGLSLAWFLKKQDPSCQITILEEKSKLGGWIQTHQTFGYLFELGPHSLRLSSPYAAICDGLFHDLGIQEQIIEPTTGFKNRLLCYGNQLHPVKMNPLSLLNPKNFFKLTYPILKNTLQKHRPIHEDMTIEEFFQGRFGDYITKHWVDPLVMGVKGGDIQNLSFKSSFPNAYELAQGNKPLTLALMKNAKQKQVRYLSFENGLSTLIEALAKNLDATIETETPALKIQFLSKPQVLTANGILECDHIFSTLPAYALSKILDPKPELPLHYLKEQKHISYKVLHIGYDAKIDLPAAFGCISPSWSQQLISGMIFDSVIFPQHNFHHRQTRITAMVHENSPLYYMPSQKFEDQFFNELNSILNIHIAPQYFEVFDLKQAIAQYELGHDEKVREISESLSQQLPHFSLCGASFYGLSVPQCIDQAYKLAHQFSKREFISKD